jgi:hypothetical protein
MADDPPNELKAALAEGRTLIVCGAGVSMGHDARRGAGVGAADPGRARGSDPAKWGKEQGLGRGV